MIALAVLASALLLCTVDATDCKACLTMDISCSNPFAAAMLESVFSSMKDADCFNNSNAVASIPCPTDKCSVTDATVDVSMATAIGNIDMTMSMLVRGCVHPEEASAQNGCVDLRDMEDEIVASMGLPEGSATVNDVGGYHCVCDTDDCNAR